MTVIDLLFCSPPRFVGAALSRGVDISRNGSDVLALAAVDPGTYYAALARYFDITSRVHFSDVSTRYLNLTTGLCRIELWCSLFPSHPETELELCGGLSSAFGQRCVRVRDESSSSIFGQRCGSMLYEMSRSTFRPSEESVQMRECVPDFSDPLMVE